MFSTDMAENDIYDHKGKYDRLVADLNQILIPPKQANSSLKGKTKYYCKNSDNLIYFEKLIKKFASKDISFVRRLRLLGKLKFITFISNKNLLDIDRDDVDEIVGAMHEVNPSPKSKRDFILDFKHLWKQLFPEKDEKGRIDDTLVPYPVRHLSNRMDKSKEKRREDKITIDEFEKLVQSFAQDKRLQAFLTLSYESLGRPQEILYTRIKDAELSDNYGRIWISQHGKEGTGFLEVIDSFPYVAEWLNQHPLRHDPNAFIFINLGNTGKYKQLKNTTINKHIRDKMKVLGISKPVTCYSLKRSGVTFRRLRGDNDVEIQHAARWTSNKQLKTYDLSNHDDSFKIALEKKGLIKIDSSFAKESSKTCLFCKAINGIGIKFCKTCKRPLDRKKITELEKSKDEELKALKEQYTDLQDQMNEINSFMNKVVKRKPEIMDIISEEA